MKKAKIVLGAVAAFAVVGGAFAFNVARTTEVLYTRTVPTATICEATYRAATFTTTLSPNIKTITYATSVQGAPCTTLTTVYSGL